MRAMVLAAGFGTRLRPLTENLPKPLLPVANRPLLEYTFALLSGAGVTEVIVNAHHLAEVLEDGIRRLDTSGLGVHFSRERRILGTAGGPKKAEPFLGDGEGTFFLVNGDFLIDLDLREAAEFHRQRGARATMVLREDNEGGIYVDSSGRITQFLEPGREPSPRWRRCGFTGVHVLEPGILDLVPANTPWEINRQVYPEALRRGWPVFGLIHRGYWREAGDPPGYLAANLEVLEGGAGSIALRPGSGLLASRGRGILPPVLLGEGAVVEDGAKLGPGVVVGPGARIGRDSSLARAVVLEGSDIVGGEKGEDTIRSPWGTLTAATGR